MAEFDLIAIVLVLRTEVKAQVPDNLGRAHYAATLARLEALDCALAEQVHAGNRAKPLTCSNVINGQIMNKRRVVTPEEDYHVRVTGLTQTVSEALATVFLEERPSTLTLHGHCFQVADVICDSQVHPWSGRNRYDALGIQPSSTEICLQLSSPTTFHSNNMDMPLPLPGLVFGSLVDRWNTFAPQALSPGIRRFSEEKVAVSHFQLESDLGLQKRKTPRIGSKGYVTYRILSQDAYLRRAIHRLAEFALYSGVGTQTMIGMGQVRLLSRGKGRAI